MLWSVGSLGKRWAFTFGGRIIRKVDHENTKIASQGAGFNWGISPGVVGRHHSLA